MGGKIGSVISGSAIAFLSMPLTFLVRGCASRASAFAATVFPGASARCAAMGEMSRAGVLAMEPGACRSITMRSGSESRKAE